MNAEFFHDYKRQNPVKYQQKYGDKLPEELADGYVPPVTTDPIKVEMTAKDEVEQDFKPVPKVKKIKRTTNEA